MNFINIQKWKQNNGNNVKQMTPSGPSPAGEKKKRKNAAKSQASESERGT